MLEQNTKVKFEYSGISGEGEVVGISTELPILGCMYIIKTDKIISEIYPYDTFICPECYIKFHS